MYASHYALLLWIGPLVVRFQLVLRHAIYRVGNCLVSSLEVPKRHVFLRQRSRVEVFDSHLLMLCPHVT